MPNYRRYFLGSAVSVIGTWMQRVAQDWLVLQLSHSAVALGIATALQFAPVLFAGLWGGVLIDRADRRVLLLATQASAAVLAALLAVLSLTGAVTLWMVYVLAFALGVVTVFDSPGRQAFLTELVERDDLVNAQALYSSVHNGGRLVGPALAGVLIAAAGVGWTFAVNAASYVAVFVALLRIDRRLLLPAIRAKRSPGQAREGVRYVWRRPQLRATLLAVLLIGIFAQNYRVVLPLLAQRTFAGDARTYGWLTAAMGVGAVAGALGSAAMERVTGSRLAVAALAFGVTNVAVAVSPRLVVALAALVTLGTANIVVNTVARTLVLTDAGAGMQGRVMSLYTLVFLGSTPIGGPLVGGIMAVFGARSGLVVGAASAFAATMVVAAAARGAAPVQPVRAVPDEMSAEDT